MKKSILIATLGLLSFNVSAQDTPKAEEGFIFTTVKENPITSVKNQNRSSTCWSFSALGFLESELLRMGKGEYDLSEMFVVHHTMMDRGVNYVRYHGDSSFSPGGSFYDIMFCLRNYGLVPQEAMPGIMYGDTLPVHNELDAVGGIELSPSDDEVRVANNYINEMCKLRNADASAHQYTSSGDQHVDGYQAVAYARIRYVGNSDYQRTERQREVLSKMMQEMKSSSVTELSALADTILPSVTHNIDQSTLMTLIGELPTILSYEIVQSRVPYDDLYSSKGEMLVPDFSATISRLQTEIYGSTTVNE